jgi:hypothetical protein
VEQGRKELRPKSMCGSAQEEILQRAAHGVQVVQQKEAVQPEEDQKALSSSALPNKYRLCV